MNRVLRNKLTILESTLSKHAAMETRMLSDLRRAGFRFRTIEQAYQTMRAQRTMHLFTEEQINLAIRLMDEKARTK